LMNAVNFGATTNVTLDNVVIHDVGWAIHSNSSQTTIGPNVEVYNMDHGFVFGAPSGQTISSVVFYGNHFHDYAIWDDSMDCNHHDGIHGFGTTTAGTVVTDFWAFDNVFDGDTGQTFNQQIFLEGTNDGTPWTTSPTSLQYIFNNVFVATTPHSPPITGMSGVGSGIFVNNTTVGQNPSYVSACNDFGANGSSPALVENNAVEGCGALVGGNETTSTVTFQVFDYNGYANCDGYNCFFANLTGTAIDTASFATWQTQSGFDAHSVSDPGSVGYGVDAGSNFFALNAGYVPQAGSPLIGTGANLSYLCDAGLPLLASLCFDLAGNPRRPANDGGWDIGALSYCSGSGCLDAGSFGTVSTAGSTGTTTGGVSATGGTTAGAVTSGTASTAASSTASSSTSSGTVTSGGATTGGLGATTVTGSSSSTSSGATTGGAPDGGSTASSSNGCSCAASGSPSLLPSLWLLLGLGRLRSRRRAR
jgi:hypothetical protein